MSDSIPPFPHMSSWHTHRQFSFARFEVVTALCEDSSLQGCNTVLFGKWFLPILRGVPFILKQWFPECALRIPRDPWIHFCNGYFGVYLLFLVKGMMFC